MAVDHGRLDGTLAVTRWATRSSRRAPSHEPALLHMYGPGAACGERRSRQPSTVVLTASAFPGGTATVLRSPVDLGTWRQERRPSRCAPEAASGRERRAPAPRQRATQASPSPALTSTVAGILSPDGACLASEPPAKTVAEHLSSHRRRLPAPEACVTWRAASHACHATTQWILRSPFDHRKQTRSLRPMVASAHGLTVLRDRTTVDQ